MENTTRKTPPKYVTTKENPQIAAKMKAISKKVFEKNKEVYKRLATR